MIILREYLSSTIRYDNFFVFIIIYNIGYACLKTKLSFLQNTSILNNFEVLFWLQDFFSFEIHNIIFDNFEHQNIIYNIIWSFWKFKYHFWYDMIIFEIYISIWYDKFLNPDIMFQDDMIISLVCYQWSRRYDKADNDNYRLTLVAHQTKFVPRFTIQIMRKSLKI